MRQRKVLRISMDALWQVLEGKASIKFPDVLKDISFRFAVSEVLDQNLFLIVDAEVTGHSTNYCELELVPVGSSYDKQALVTQDEDFLDTRVI